MSDFEILQELIKDEIRAPVECEYNKRTIILEEPGNQEQSAYSLKIRNVPDTVFAFKSDAFPPPKRFFKDKKGECKRADFVLVANGDRANWIVYIEMKSGSGGSGGEVEQ